MTVPETTRTLVLPLIDLNKDRREERRQVFRRSRRLGGALLTLLVAIGAALLPLTLQAITLHGELIKTQGQAKEARSRLQTVTAASAEMDGRIRLWERLAQTRQSRRVWGAIIPSLAACLPQDVFLQQVQISGKGQDAALQIQGAAGTMAGLRAFTTALAGSPLFARVHLDEAVADRAAGHSGLTFRITGPMTIRAASSPP